MHLVTKTRTDPAIVLTETLRHVANLRPRGWYETFRTVFDFALALSLLLLTAPLIVLAMLLIKATSRGPIFYTQTRLGRNGRPFSIYKLRTMKHLCESLTGPRWTQPGDSRITPVGRWLRRTHLDELPQLWNVLRGDMSLIGPRPERPEFVPQLECAIPHYRQRMLVRPGVTGLAQVQLPPDSDLDSVKRKLAYDLYYIDRMSPWLDLRIYWATAVHMFGIPFQWIRGIFRFPHQETIEAFYHTLTAPTYGDPQHHTNGNQHSNGVSPAKTHDGRALYPKQES